MRSTSRRPFGFGSLSRSRLSGEACSSDDAGLLDHRFRLRRWPSFTQLRHSPAQITMTGRLVRQSLSIHELVADGRIELLEAILRLPDPVRWWTASLHQCLLQPGQKIAAQLV